MISNKKHVTRKQSFITPKGRGLYLEREEKNPLSDAIDSVGGFLTMVETCIKGNPRFDLEDVCDEWYESFFKEKRKRSSDVQKDILKISIKIFVDTCKKSKVAMPRQIVKIRDAVFNDSFYSLSRKEILDLAKMMSTHITHSPSHQQRR